VTAHGNANVIEVERVGGGAVDKSGLERGGSKVVAKDSGLADPTLLADQGGDFDACFFTAARQHHAERIEDRAAGLLSGLRRYRGSWG